MAGHTDDDSFPVGLEVLSRGWNIWPQQWSAYVFFIESNVSDTKARKAVPTAITNESFSPRADNQEYQAPNHAIPNESFGFLSRISEVDTSQIPRFATEAQDQSGDFGYASSFLLLA